MSEWHDSVDDVILDVEPGDRVEFEYDGSTDPKTGEVEGLNQGCRATLHVDVDGAERTWKIGTGISITYEDKNRGQQSRYLGSLERIRVIEG